MGVMCQILLHRPLKGYYSPGDPVTGILKYAIDEVTEYKDVKISLQGKGRCSWTENQRTGHGKKQMNQQITYIGTEEFVNVKLNVLNGPTLLQVGAYEHNFKFMLPLNLPSTYKDYNCSIKYSIKIKMERPGLFNLTKKFYTEITVKNSSRPILSQEPTSFELEKTLIKLFKSNQRINLKSIIQKTILEAGEFADLNFEVTNNATVTIPCVQAKLYEIKTYRANCGKVKRSSVEVSGSVAVTPSIPHSSTAHLSLRVPSNKELYSVPNSRIFSREYKMQVTIKLPFPHINATRDIDVVFYVPKHTDNQMMGTDEYELPPPYWLVMVEDSKEMG